MPVSLGRRLRRIDIPLKEHRTADWSPARHTIGYKERALDLIANAKNERLLARSKCEEPSRPHRRSKSRIKRGREEVKGYPTSGSKKR